MQSIENSVKLAEWVGLKRYPDCLPGHPAWMIPYRPGVMVEADLPAYLDTWEGTGRLIEKMQGIWRDSIIAEVDLPDALSEALDRRWWNFTQDNVQQAALKIIEEAKADGQD